MLITIFADASHCPETRVGGWGAWAKEGGMSVKDTWEMQCPSCGGDESLDIRAHVYVRLTEDGTDAGESFDGSHEWDGESFCTCAACGWSGTVKEAEDAYKKAGGGDGEDEKPDLPDPLYGTGEYI